MNILLINPDDKNVYHKLSNVSTKYPPLGLLYLAAVSEREGHVVKIVDLPVEPFTDGDLANIINEFCPDIVGFSVTTPLSTRAHEIASLIKSISNPKIVFGGPHSTALFSEELKDKSVDFVVIGEGEVTFAELLSSNFKNLDKIDGLAYKHNGRIIKNPPRQLINDLDSIPFPAYHLIDFKKYFFLDARSFPLTDIFTTRGCPFNCVYCNKNIFGHNYRVRSVKNVVDEIELLSRKFGVKEIHILDDSINFNKDRFIDICDEIIRRKIVMSFDCCNLRADHVSDYLFKRMKRAGFYKVAFGIESGDQRILKNIRKSLRLSDVENAVSLAQKNGLEVWGYFMVGLPGESIATIKKTVNFAIKLDLDVAKFHIATPLPGTKFFDDLDKKGLIRTHDWAEYSIWKEPTFLRIGHLSSKDILRMQKYCVRGFFLRPKYILKRIRTISSFKHFLNIVRTGFSIIKNAI